MTEKPEEFAWLSGCETLDEIYCVSFVRGIPPEEVLRRFGVDENTMEEVTFDELDERSAESMRDDVAGYIGAAQIGGWTLVIEPGDGRSPSTPRSTAGSRRGPRSCRSAATTTPRIPSPT